MLHPHFVFNRKMTQFVRKLTIALQQIVPTICAPKFIRRETSLTKCIAPACPMHSDDFTCSDASHGEKTDDAERFAAVFRSRSAYFTYNKCLFRRCFDLSEMFVLALASIVCQDLANTCFIPSRREVLSTHCRVRPRHRRSIQPSFYQQQVEGTKSCWRLIRRLPAAARVGINKHVQLLPHEQPPAARVDRVNHLQHARVDAFRVVAGE